MKPFEVHLAGNRGVFEPLSGKTRVITERLFGEGAGARPFGGNTDNATMLIARERTVQHGINPVNNLRSL